MRVRAPIDAVLLDLGGVFYLPDHDAMRSALARIGVARAPSDLDRVHYESVAAAERFLGPDGNPWRAYTRAYASVCGVAPERVDDAGATLRAQFTRGDVWTRPIPGAREALAELAARGLALAIVSNADGTVEAQLAADGVCQVGAGAGVPVGIVVDSHVVGVAKPDPAIFRVALAALGVDARRAVHVGDLPPADVAGARAAGVQPVLVDPFGLHPAADCARVSHLAELVELLGRG